MASKDDRFRWNAKSRTQIIIILLTTIIVCAIVGILPLYNNRWAHDMRHHRPIPRHTWGDTRVHVSMRLSRVKHAMDQSA